MELKYARCAGLDVHKDTVVACMRITIDGKVSRTTKTFGTLTRDLYALQAWLVAEQVTHVAMEATGVYWKPVWHILEESVELILANPAHIKNVPGRKTVSTHPTPSCRDRRRRVKLRHGDSHEAPSSGPLGRARVRARRLGAVVGTVRQEQQRRRPLARLVARPAEAGRGPSVRGGARVTWDSAGPFAGATGTAPSRGRHRRAGRC